MPTKKKKRKYTFRKDQTIPYESGSIIHQIAKAEKETQRTMQKSPKRKKRSKK